MPATGLANSEICAALWSSLTMYVDPVMISVLALVVALIALLFGPGIALRGLRVMRERLRNRSAHKRQLLEFLQDAAVFLDGLPLFITETWSWGPSVPN